MNVAEAETDYKNHSEHSKHCWVCGKKDRVIRDYCRECANFFGIKE